MHSIGILTCDDTIVVRTASIFSQRLEILALSLRQVNLFQWYNAFNTRIYLYYIDMSLKPFQVHNEAGYY